MCIMKNYVMVNVKETGQTWSSEDDFVLQKPDLEVSRLILRDMAALFYLGFPPKTYCCDTKLCKEEARVTKDNSCSTCCFVKVSVPDTARVRKFLKIHVRFQNPLDVELTRCVFSLEAAGVLRSSEMR